MELIQAVDDYIAKAPENQQEILIRLRELIVNHLPHCSEHLKWKMPVYENRKMFCYLRSTQKYAVLGFYNYHDLEDPENYLEGTGKNLRHIKIKNWKDFKEKTIIKMLKQAST